MAGLYCLLQNPPLMPILPLAIFKDWFLSNVALKWLLKNITSLPRHIDELCIVLYSKCLDLLAINETR